MIDFYSYGTINGMSVAMTLEELALDYQYHAVDLMRGAHRQPEFLALNPSGRIPVIVDHSVAADQPLVLSQTGAIMVYLAEKAGRLLPTNPADRAKAMQWLWFQLTDISTNVFNNFYLKSLVDPQQPQAAEQLKQRAIGFYQVFDQQLAEHRFLAGEQISIADLASFTVVTRLLPELTANKLQHLLRWQQEVAARPAVAQVMQQFG